MAATLSSGDSKPMEPVATRLEVWPVIILVLCLALFILKAVTSMVQESATWDETHYFGLGKYILQNHKWDVPGAISHPPLSYYLHSIPLLFFPTDQTVWQRYRSRGNTFNDVLRGQALLSSPENKGDRLLTLARLMMVLTATLLGYFVFLWSYSLYGKWSAVLAIILYSFSPNILAHARLITPDITLTTFFFITLYFFWRLLRNWRTGDLVLGGFFLGLALLSKFPGVLLFPICFLLMLFWRATERKLELPHCLAFAVIGAGILLIGYQMNPAAYLAGIKEQLRLPAAQAPHFLHGHCSPDGWWYYFIVAFFIKTPIPTLIFLAIAAALFIKNGWERSWIGDAWINELFLLLPAAFIFYFFSLNRVQIGLRYVLPVYPLLFVFASGAARWCFSSRAVKALYLVATAWLIGASSWIHPHYLAYFNELIGGPDNGWEYLVDSNLDWGQDLKGLKAYMEQHGISKISLSYFGSDSPERYSINYDWLPSFYLRDPGLARRQQGFPRKGWFAISATCLQGCYFDNTELLSFKSRKPDAKIGYSIFLYNMDDAANAGK